MLASEINPKAISIYVHWPFCLSKCPYCDFNSHVRESVNETDMCKALQSEVNYFANLVGDRTVKSIFFGGGTPSLMSAKTVESVIDKISSHWTFSKNIEISLESNKCRST